MDRNLLTASDVQKFPHTYTYYKMGSTSSFPVHFDDPEQSYCKPVNDKRSQPRTCRNMSKSAPNPSYYLKGWIEVEVMISSAGSEDVVIENKFDSRKNVNMSRLKE